MIYRIQNNSIMNIFEAAKENEKLKKQLKESIGFDLEELIKQLKEKDYENSNN